MTFGQWLDFCSKRKIDPKDHEWIVRITRRIDMHKWRDSRYDAQEPRTKGPPCSGES